MPILITGSKGLIGRYVIKRLADAGIAYREFDIRHDRNQDVRNSAALAKALEGASGVVHLAAISRVVWAQNNPALAQAINIAPLAQILSHARIAQIQPWIIFASSREVYGHADHFPVCDDAPHRPLNVYARTKTLGEEMMAQASADGILANICRFSNVYGCVSDHPDRVVTAFAREAAHGGQLLVEGAENIFDFCHVDDVADGLFLAIKAAIAGQSLPPLHFVTGRPYSLGELALLAQNTSKMTLSVRMATPRNFDVSKFYGDPARTQEILGWRAKITIEQGISKLIDDFSQQTTPPSRDLWIHSLAA